MLKMMTALFQMLAKYFKHTSTLRVRDNHSKKNRESYETWFTTKLVANIQPNSVIVIDNAPYHSVYTGIS